MPFDTVDLGNTTCELDALTHQSKPEVTTVIHETGVKTSTVVRDDQPDALTFILEPHNDG